MSSITNIANSLPKALNITKAKSKFNIDFSKISAQLNSLSADKFEKTSGDAIFSKATFEKAKEMVIESILGNNSKESLVVINDDKIIYHAIGNAHAVGDGDTKLFSLLNDPKKRIALIHSHPTALKDGSARPVSIGDFINLNSHPAERSVYAINSLGEYSMLQKQGNTRPSALKMMDYEKKYESEVIESLSGEERKFLRKHWTALDDMCKLPQEELERLKKEYWDFSNKESVVKATSQATHDFWLKYAPALGVKYDTNYSCFV